MVDCSLFGSDVYLVAGCRLFGSDVYLVAVAGCRLFGCDVYLVAVPGCRVGSDVYFICCGKLLVIWV